VKAAGAGDVGVAQAALEDLTDGGNALSRAAGGELNPDALAGVHLEVRVSPVGAAAAFGDSIGGQIVCATDEVIDLGGAGQAGAEHGADRVVGASAVSVQLIR